MTVNALFKIYLITFLFLMGKSAWAQNPPDTPQMLIIQVEPTNENPGQVRVVWNDSGDNIKEYQFHKLQAVAGLDSRFFPYPDGDAYGTDTFRVDMDGRAHIKSEKYSVVAWDFNGSNSNLAEGISSIFLPEVVYDSCTVTAQLNWTPFDGANDGTLIYQIWRQENQAEPVLFHEIQDTFYLDAQLNQNTDYLYTIKVSTFYGVSISNTQSISVKTPSVPQEDQNIVKVTIENNLVEFTTTIDNNVSVLRYDLFESMAQDGDYIVIQSRNEGDGSALVFNAELYNPSKYYKMNTLGVCNIYVDSTNVVRPIYLEMDQKDTEVNLSWHASFIGTTENYTLKVFVDGIPMNDIALGSDLEFPLNIDEFGKEQAEVFDFQIQAENEFGFLSLSNVVSATRIPTVTMPNAFTPNGDKLNDKIGPFNKTNEQGYVYFKNADVDSFTSFEIIIYDKYGGRVFESNDLSAFWEGTFGGYQVSEGPHPYVINFTTGQGKSFSHSGIIEVLYPYESSER